MEIYTIRNLIFSYPRQEKKTLNNISFSVNQGEFITLCGSSGCGKTTLLRQLKTVLKPYGEVSGEILFEGKPLADIDQYDQSTKIGFVFQSPDNQIVTDKVWHELAFGLESLGLDTPTIRLRVAEMASFFGIQNWFYKNVSELSGGQKQLLNLAAIMVMQPSVLILDEPTSQLDPIAAADFLKTVSRINRELGVTVIMTEHRLEEVLSVSDRVLVMDQGRIICDSRPEEVGRQLRDRRHSMFLNMPVSMRVYAGVENDLPCPLTVRDGRIWLDDFAKDHSISKLPKMDTPKSEETGTPIIELDEIWFRYEKDGSDVVKGLSAKIFPGQFHAILGGNGTGKTTTLSIISGINKPYRGKVKINGQLLSDISRRELFNEMLGVLPQNPKALFVKKTVEEDLYEMLYKQRISKEEKKNKVHEVSKLCCLDELLSMHPYDLSGGEQQRAALGKVLLLRPKVLILDEPTKGMDEEFKQAFGAILSDLLEEGVTIVMASHDIEFCAQYAHYCSLFFDGSIVSCDVPRLFFTGNSFYTTAANRMARHKLPGAMTVEDLITACTGKEVSFEVKLSKKDNKESDSLLQEKKTFKNENNLENEESKNKIPLWRKMMIAFSAVAFLLTTWFITGHLEDLSSIIPTGNTAAESVNRIDVWRYVLLIIAWAMELCVFFWAIYLQKTGQVKNEQIPADRRFLSKRTLAAAAIILVAIPMTIYIGIYYLDDRKYYFISMLIILETMLPFVIVFEDRKPQARELIVIAVLCAIGVAGRAVFFMLPQFKPVVAIVIIAGVAFGGEAGFLVGAVTGFVSNIFFGQGPWTPWQMFAFGIIGFLAGVLFRKGILRRNTIALCFFGGFAAFFIYGAIMNPAAVLMFQSHPTKEMFYLAYIRGIPFDLIHAAATVIFLFLLAKPLLEKLDRIKIKYGLIEN